MQGIVNCMVADTPLFSSSSSSSSSRSAAPLLRLSELDLSWNRIDNSCASPLMDMLRIGRGSSVTPLAVTLRANKLSADAKQQLSNAAAAAAAAASAAAVSLSAAGAGQNRQLGDRRQGVFAAAKDAHTSHVRAGASDESGASSVRFVDL